MAREIPLTGLIDTIQEMADAEWKPIVVLDPAGNSEIFFKYKACLLMAYLPGEATDHNMKMKFIHSVTRGDTLVLAIDQEKDPHEYFKEEVFPIELLNKQALTYEFLDPLIEDKQANPPQCAKDYKFVVLVQKADVPGWVNDSFHIIKIVQEHRNQLFEQIELLVSPCPFDDEGRLFVGNFD